MNRIDARIGELASKIVKQLDLIKQVHSSFVLTADQLNYDEAILYRTRFQQWQEENPQETPTPLDLARLKTDEQLARMKRKRIMLLPRDALQIGSSIEMLVTAIREAARGLAETDQAYVESLLVEFSDFIQDVVSKSPSQFLDEILEEIEKWRVIWSALIETTAHHDATTNVPVEWREATREQRLEIELLAIKFLFDCEHNVTQKDVADKFAVSESSVSRYWTMFKFARDKKSLGYSHDDVVKDLKVQFKDRFSR